MRKPAEPLIEKYFADWEHPYRRFQREVDELLRPGSTLLDVGCGRTAPVLQRYRNRGYQLIGIDCVDFTVSFPDIALKKRAIENTGLPDASVDVVMARSVMEHVRTPAVAYAELRRILRPGGRFVFLTANKWDYASVIARLVPNRLHGRIVRFTEGRAEEDVFPTAYESNSRSDIVSLAAESGLNVDSIVFLGQYPNYLLFSKALFLVGTAYEKLIARYTPLHPLRGWILATLARPTP
jgi:SAM-dependent methyltransferase